MTSMARLTVALTVLVLAHVPVTAQGPAGTGQPAAPAGQAGQKPEPPRGFDYNPAGRRDPFVSLIGRGTTTDRASQGGRPAGLAGLETAEVALKGTMQTPNGTVAMLQGADGRTYVVHPGDKLRDGAVRAITQNALVIVQNVTDPLSLEKQREVRKTIRQSDEAK
jgi:Tfp pilus assembly protein PilP